MSIIRLFVCLSAGAALMTAGTLLDTSGFSTSSSISPWGASFAGGGSTSTYGEVVTAPAGESVLTSFTFYVQGRSVTTPLNFMAYVFPFVVDAPGSFTFGHAGSALWSAPGTQGGTGVSFVPLTFNPGIAVTAGDTYALVLTTLGVQNPQPADLSSQPGFTWLAYDSFAGRKYPGAGFVGSSDNNPQYQQRVHCRPASAQRPGGVGTV